MKILKNTIELNWAETPTEKAPYYPKHYVDSTEGEVIVEFPLEEIESLLNGDKLFEKDQEVVELCLECLEFFEEILAEAQPQYVYSAKWTMDYVWVYENWIREGEHGYSDIFIACRFFLDEGTEFQEDCDD